MVHSMNQNTRSYSPPGAEQVARLRQIIAEVVQCCQDRMLIESKIFDLPQAEIRCLMLFKDERYLTAGEAAVRLEVGKSRVSTLIGDMAERGLLARVPDPRDGRVMLLHLTDKGKAKLSEIDGFVSGLHAKLLDGLEPAQRSSLLAGLDLLHQAMEEVKAELKGLENSSY